MIEDIFLVGIGSGIGGICRYLISVLMGYAHNGFPWGTFVANISGCLLIGYYNRIIINNSKKQN